MARGRVARDRRASRDRGAWRNIGGSPFTGSPGRRATAVSRTTTVYVGSRCYPRVTHISRSEAEVLRVRSPRWRGAQVALRYYPGDALARDLGDDSEVEVVV